MCHHSGRGWKHTHWRPVHSGVLHNPWHSYRWRSLRCWRTDHHVHKGWSLLMKKKKWLNSIRSGEQSCSFTCCFRLSNDLPMLHSSLSILQVLPVYPDGQLQLNMPLMGLVSHFEPPLQGLLIQASARWHSRPVRSKTVKQYEIDCEHLFKMSNIGHFYKQFLLWGLPVFP